MRSGDVTVRRVDPSRIVQGRYDHSDANKQKQQSDHAQDDEADRAEDREKNVASLPPSTADEATMPRLLANRPVLRWLRTGDGAGSSSTFDRFLTTPEDETLQCPLADHLAASPQSSLQAMLARTDLPVPAAEPPSTQLAEQPDDPTRAGIAARYDPPEAPPPSFDAEG